MEHLLEPLERLRAKTMSFVRQKEVHSFCVAAEAAVFTNAVKMLHVACEISPHASGPVMLVTCKDEPGWAGLGAALKSEFARHREASQFLRPLEATGVATPTPERFMALVNDIAKAFLATPEAPTELTLILVPEVAGVPPGMTADFVVMAGLPRPPGVRFVWVDVLVAGRSAPKFAEPEKVMFTEVRINPEQRRRDIDAALDALASGASGAGPRKRPPRPHPCAAPAPSKRHLSKFPSQDLLAAFAEALRALGRGDTSTAVALQRRARDAAVDTGNGPLTAEMDLLLATYAFQALAERKAATTAARSELSAGIARATANSLFLQAGKMSLVLATIFRLDGEHEAAATAYAKAAALGAQAKLPALEIEAWRLAAEMLIGLGSRQAAIAALSAAVKVGRTLPLTEARETSAAICAEMLATLARQLGLETKAQRLDELGVHLAAGASTDGPVPQAPLSSDDTNPDGAPVVGPEGAT